MSFGNSIKIIIILLISQLFRLKFVACDLNAIDFLAIKPRIVGGYRLDNQSLAKYVVSLRSRKETKNHFGYTHFCAGTILTNNKILTAAHCIYSKGKSLPASSLKVVALTPKRLNRNTNTQEINVKELIVHANYRESSLFNDIALLILEKEIELDSDFAAIIQLPTATYEAGRLCEVIGWGRLYMHGPLANEIVQVDLHMRSRQYCRRRYPHFGSKKICASNMHDIEKDACSGDSGGPMICGGILTGIVSYGIGCPSNRASVYTHVFMYLDWINKNKQGLLRPSMFAIVVNLLLSGL